MEGPREGETGGMGVTAAVVRGVEEGEEKRASGDEMTGWRMKSARGFSRGTNKASARLGEVLLV